MCVYSPPSVTRVVALPCGTTCTGVTKGRGRRFRVLFLKVNWVWLLQWSTVYGSLSSFDTVATVSCKSTPLSSFID